MLSTPTTIVPPSQASGPSDDTAERLACIWQEELGVDVVSPDQNFFDLGGDSSLAVRMFSQVEKIFGVKLPLATLYDAPTIDELAVILRGEASNHRWSPLVPIQIAGSRPPFFCIHGAGGTVLMYRELSQHLGDDQPFYGLQSQGLDGISPSLRRVEEMAAIYVTEIRKAQPQGPYFIGGYCMGGTVAYEVAQQFCEQGETVALLALFDTMNWHKIPLNIWSKSSHAMERLVFHATSFLSLGFADKTKFFEEKVEVLRARIPVWKGKLLSRFQGNGHGASSDSLVLAQIWQANDWASWTYVPKPYPGVLTDFRPRTQYRVFSKLDYKWDRLVKGLEVVVLPVNPASMLVEPFVGQLAIALRQSIDAAMQRGKAVSTDHESRTAAGGS
jgi:phthiocerol/phenolphthiocerol synthesis type-I polyketide synthase E